MVYIFFQIWRKCIRQANEFLLHNVEIIRKCKNVKYFEKTSPSPANEFLLRVSVETIQKIKLKKHN